ncbi:uncharacterized protein [Leptinotarsa decemlineata]|uniref:uncharacterized protein n=1 Tax=Leptinotarsa decemlineata TaxID=7539 RepID=UPI000C2548EC|nr:uncharacterized protein LOC111502467 [Leptinotarsa decemlineata]
MNFWNVKDLSLPPINTYKCSNKDIDLNYLHEICQELKAFLENKYMRAEFLVLSRIIYRMKQKFRSAKDFKALEKLNKALEILFKLDIQNDVTTFMELIPPRYKDETYLPTKNMLDYLLVRFQGLTKLMERIVETCKISAFLLSMRMKTGHFWRVGFISFALVSRVYILAKFNTNRICEFYRKLLPFSNKLQNLGKNWLPLGYMLPKDLKEWMNVSWLDFDDVVQIIETPEISDIMKFFDLVENEDDDVEFCDEYIMIGDSEVDKCFKNLQKPVLLNRNIVGPKEFRGFNCNEDIGEIIEIKDPKVVNGNCDISNNENDVIYLSDNSVEFVGGQIERKNRDELKVIPSLSSTKKMKKQKNRRKNNDSSLAENLIHFETDTDCMLVSNETREYNVENQLFVNKTKTVQTSSEQKNNIDVKKRKSKIKQNRNVKKIKLDVETTRRENSFRNKSVDLEDPMKVRTRIEKEITGKQLKKNDVGGISDISESNIEQKTIIKNELETIKIPDMPLRKKVTSKLKKQKTRRKNKENSQTENSIHFEADTNGMLVLNKIKEYNKEDNIFSSEIKTVQTSSEQNNSVEKRKKYKIHKNKNVMKMKLDFETPGTEYPKQIDVEDLMKVNQRIDQKDIISKHLEEHVDISITPDISKLKKEQKTKANKNFLSHKVKKKLKKLDKYKKRII